MQSSSRPQLHCVVAFHLPGRQQWFASEELKWDMALTKICGLRQVELHTRESHHGLSTKHPSTEDADTTNIQLEKRKWHKMIKLFCHLPLLMQGGQHILKLNGEPVFYWPLVMVTEWSSCFLLINNHSSVGRLPRVIRPFFESTSLTKDGLALVWYKQH